MYARRQTLLEQEEGGFQVGAQYRVPVLFGGVFGGVGVKHRSVVDQRIQLPPVCTGLFRQLPELVHVGEIRVVTHGGCRALLVQLVGQCAGLLLTATVMNHNIPAASVQGFCCVGTQAVGCAAKAANP